MGVRRKIACIEEYVVSMEETALEEAVAVTEAEEPVAEQETVVSNDVNEVTAEIVEEPVEETVEEVAEEPAEVAEETAEETTAPEDVAFVAEELPEVTVEEPKKERAPAKAFDYKIVTADEITQDRYNELKNCAMQYKKLKSRISKKFDSINSGRTQFVKFGLAGKTLKVYVNLKLEDTDPKFHCKDQSFKKPYVQVPVLIRVKSGRAVKYAKRLIAQSAEYCELKPNKKYLPKDYILEVEEMYNAGLTNGEALENEAAATEEE